MKTGLKSIVGLCAAGSLMASSSAAVASAPAPVTRADPWAVLSAMSGGAPAAAMCGTAAMTAVQGQAGCVLPVVDVPPAAAAAGTPVPAAPVVAGAGLAISPLLLGLLAIAVGAGIFLAVHNSGNGRPNSPA